MSPLPAYQTYLKRLVSGRTYVKVQYFTELHELITCNALLAGFTEAAGEPIVILSTGEQIPLTWVVSVDGQFSPNYEGYAPYCETCDR
ncbi:hypothetical protein GCM10027578_35450 [Spirosoma luteolum]